MSKFVEWKCRYFDTAHISAGTYPAGGTLAKFFRDDPSVNRESITDKNERELVDQLFTQYEFRALLFPELGLRPDSFYRTHVTTPLIDDPQEKPGDIDVLICERERPDEAVALECKRVKVVAVSAVDDDLNKVHDIKDGAAQTKAMATRMRFHRTFLAILVQVDGRNRRDFNTLMRGLNPRATFDGEQTTLKRIYEFPQSGMFHEDVGFVFIEVIQPTGKSFEDNGGICLRVHKNAKRLAQPDNLTNRISSIIGEVTP